jgi:hypothetical protein
MEVSHQHPRFVLRLAALEEIAAAPGEIGNRRT